MSDDPEDTEGTELFERLRSHDPAASLPPAEPAQVARLLEEAVSHDLDSPTRRRSPRSAPFRRPRSSPSRRPPSTAPSRPSPTAR